MWIYSNDLSTIQLLPSSQRGKSDPNYNGAHEARDSREKKIGEICSKAVITDTFKI